MTRGRAHRALVTAHAWEFGAGPTARQPADRRLVRWGVAGAVAALALLLVAGRADAHAELVSTEPAASQQLATAPDRVVLHFTESVDMTDDTIEVLDATGEPVEVGEPEHPGGDGAAVAVSLPPLDDGTYVVAWRVVSSDSHPVGGAFTFGVGDAGTVAVDDQALIDDVLGGSKDGDRTLGAVYGVVRFLGFGGLAVLAGSVVFLAWLWPAGAGDRQARRVVAGAWLASVVAAVLSIPLQGAYAGGGTLGDALSADVIADEMGTRTGRSWVVRLVLLAAAAVVLPRLGRLGASAGRGMAVAGGLALTLPERDLGPITVQLVDYGQGHWSADAAEFPFPGDWQLELLVRTSDIDQTRFAVTIPVA